MSDFKQFLLMHVEKFVLVVMGLLLVAVIFIYEPWNTEILQKQQIHDRLQNGLNEMNRTTAVIPLVPEDFTVEIRSLYQTPWQDTQAPSRLARNKPIFWNLPRKGVWKERAPEAPVVIPVKAVYAKGDRGQVVIVFQIDDLTERHALGDTAVQDYQNGLEFERIEIYRVDRGSNEKPVLITPENWRPEGLPNRYGAPVGSTGMLLTPTFDVPVYVYAQAKPPAPYGGGVSDAERQRQEEQRIQMEEEMRRQMERTRQMEEERRIRGLTGPGPTPSPIPTPGPRTPITSPGPRTPITTPSPRPGPVRTPRPGPDTTGSAPSGWYYFVDQGVDPDGRYEYNVVIVCKNPVYQQYKDSREGVREFVSSEPKSTPPSAVVKVESYKSWYFQGGTHSDQMELGTFKVRSYVGGRRDFSPEEIAAIVAELSGVDTSKTKPRTPVKTTEPEGAWIEQSFTARPGEEIGGKATVTVGGERREVDFSSGCFVVSVRNDVQVTEDPRTVTVPGPDGALKTETRISRMVIPKLRLTYMDRKGVLRTKWQQVPPPLPRGKDEK